MPMAAPPRPKSRARGAYVLGPIGEEEDTALTELRALKKGTALRDRVCQDANQRASKALDVLSEPRRQSADLQQAAAPAAASGGRAPSISTITAMRRSMTRSLLRGRAMSVDERVIEEAAVRLAALVEGSPAIAAYAAQTPSFRPSALLAAGDFFRKGFQDIFQEIRSVLHVNGRWKSEHAELSAGDPHVDSCEMGAYRHFVFRVMEPGKVEITLSAIKGDPDLFVCCTNEYPTQDAHTWRSAGEGSDSITLTFERVPTLVYVGVRGAAEGENKFRLTAGSKKVIQLVPGEPVLGTVKPGKYAYFKYHHSARGKAVRVKLTSLKGDTDLFVCVHNQAPTEEKATWKSNSDGDDIITIWPSDPNYKYGWYFVGVRGFELSKTDLEFEVVCLAEKSAKKDEVKAAQASAAANFRKDKKKVRKEEMEDEELYGIKKEGSGGEGEGGGASGGEGGSDSEGAGETSDGEGAPREGRRSKREGRPRKKAHANAFKSVSRMGTQYDLPDSVTKLLRAEQVPADVIAVRPQAAGAAGEAPALPPVLPRGLATAPAPSSGDEGSGPPPPRTAATRQHRRRSPSPPPPPDEARREALEEALAGLEPLVQQSIRRVRPAAPHGGSLPPLEEASPSPPASMPSPPPEPAPEPPVPLSEPAPVPAAPPPEPAPLARGRPLAASAPHLLPAPDPASLLPPVVDVARGPPPAPSGPLLGIDLGPSAILADEPACPWLRKRTLPPGRLRSRLPPDPRPPALVPLAGPPRLDWTDRALRGLSSGGGGRPTEPRAPSPPPVRPPAHNARGVPLSPSASAPLLRPSPLPGAWKNARLLQADDGAAAARLRALYRVRTVALPEVPGARPRPPAEDRPPPPPPEEPPAPSPEEQRALDEAAGLAPPPPPPPKPRKSAMRPPRVYAEEPPPEPPPEPPAPEPLSPPPGTPPERRLETAGGPGPRPWTRDPDSRSVSRVNSSLALSFAALPPPSAPASPRGHPAPLLLLVHGGAAPLSTRGGPLSARRTARSARSARGRRTERGDHAPERPANDPSPEPAPADPAPEPADVDPAPEPSDAPDAD